MIYPYGLNNNVKNLGNVSKKGTENIVVWSLFNKKLRNSQKTHKNGKGNTEQHGQT